MYESLKNRIAALEEEEVLEEEEERRFGVCYIPVLRCSLTLRVAEEAQKSVKGMEENAIHAKYIELVRALPPDRLTPLNLVLPQVRRIQAHGARSCKGEAETRQG